MSNLERIEEYLKYKEEYVCDDCLSSILNIESRQQVNKICNMLKNKKLLKRDKSECNRCKKFKLVNYIKGNLDSNIKNINIDYDDNNLKHSEHIEIALDKYENLDFQEVKISFNEVDIDNVFKGFNKYLLKEILVKPRYNKLKNYIADKYSNDLEKKLGEFLMDLKIKGISDYKLFLNPYGDLKYCNFRVDDSSLNNKKGIYLYKIEDEIMYIGRCQDSFEKRINTGYANIFPRNCYLDGQNTNCRINNLINDNRSKVKLFILKIDDNEVIKKLEVELIEKYKPVWNIQGV